MRVSINSEIQDTSVPVRWCLSRDELNRLAGIGEKSYILLLVIPSVAYSEDYNLETRYLIPVNQMMEYVNFCTPGEHKIFVTVVWGKYEGFDLWKYFLSKHINKHKGNTRYYEHSLYDYGDKEIFKGDGFDFCNFGVHEFEVNVPKEVFAKEPPAWEKRWVDFFRESKAKDQCHYRRRRLFAYSFQPPLVLILLLGLEIATSFVIGALLLFGTKGIGFRKIFHPFAESFSSIWDETKGSIFGKGLIVRSLPSIFLGSSVISGVTYKLVGFQPYLFIKAIMTGGIAVGIVVAGPCFVALFCLGTAKITNKIRNILVPGEEERKKQKRLLTEAVEKERGRKLRERIEAEYALLACDDNLSADIRTLPKKKRTIHLRYQDFKSRVCKSFAR